MSASHAPTTACRRCGTCCRLGGPALHAADLPLLAAGRLTPVHLVTLRRGEYVADNVSGGVGPSPEELVKLAAADGRACRFFAEPDACAIHDHRPAECRILFCDAPQALEAMYRRERLTRRDILAVLPGGGPLAELCAHHEAEVNLARLAALLRRAAAGDAAARQEALRIARLDAAFRELLPARAGVPPEAVGFYLGRPPALALPGWKTALCPGGLYKRGPCA